MTWFNINALEKDLAQGNVSDKAGFNYLLTSMIIMTLIIDQSDNDTSNEVLTSIGLLVDILIIILLLKTTFDTNTKGDNKDYFKRYIALSLVSFIRLLVFAILPVAFVLLLIEMMDSTEIAAYLGMKPFIEFAISMALSIAYYFMLTGSFKRVNAKP